jgi:eukaryotic-like serine/threonine-protein kinase
LETRAQVIEQEAIPPRQFNPSVARDLETICLKAISKEPARRYSSAAELANDLKRWLAGEPITARAVGPLERGWRWCRRNPVVAGLSTAVALALVSGTIVSTYFSIQASARAREVITERERAETGFREARAAVDKYYTSVSESKLLNVPGLDPLRKELLESALEYYDKFIGEYGNDPKAQAEMARAYTRVGAITSEIGVQEQALVALEKAVKIVSKLARENPTDTGWSLILPRSAEKWAVCN